MPLRFRSLSDAFIRWQTLHPEYGRSIDLEYLTWAVVVP